ncbi:uncharacterized protein LOC144365550 isoform X2 [Ictidomys tridecemlineatus]
MNQPDSIQKSRPGPCREPLPGSLLYFGFRSPDGQLEMARESVGCPGRSAPGRRLGLRLFVGGGAERRVVRGGIWLLRHHGYPFSLSLSLVHLRIPVLWPESGNWRIQPGLEMELLVFGVQNAFRLGSPLSKKESSLGLHLVPCWMMLHDTVEVLRDLQTDQKTTS